jgi:hypothetical protein
MSQQPELITPSLPARPKLPAGSRSMSGLPSGRPAENNQDSGGAHTPPRIPRWLERAELFLRVMLRMYIGLAICYAPWSSLFWDQNPLFLTFPTLSIYAANGAVRGLVSGLGLLNLWIAFRDAVGQRTAAGQ